MGWGKEAWEIMEYIAYPTPLARHNQILHLNSVYIGSRGLQSWEDLQDEVALSYTRYKAVNMIAC